VLLKVEEEKAKPLFERREGQSRQ